MKNLSSKLKKITLPVVDKNGNKIDDCSLRPQKIICVGLNYSEHQQECDFEKPTLPVLFCKFNNALVADNEVIELQQSAIQYDYEAELAIIIGKEAKCICENQAPNYIFGYSAANDFSARDLQFVSSQWLIGKSFDQSCPIGPVVVKSGEIDPQNLSISSKVNGETRQLSNTKQMIFNCNQIVSYASHCFTLNKGDIILTGTPSGVILGKPESKRKWLKSGDKIEIIIEKIGTLTNVLK